jgi:ubiquinone/menaquinone biosynthesis C-methylase UbiE
MIPKNKKKDMLLFKDYFSQCATSYKKYRPDYPKELFKFLASECPEKELAVDVACGNGQAAYGLVPYFKKIIGIDASKEQLKLAIKNKKIKYINNTAEEMPVSPGSADLITVAQAIHWFELDKFYITVRKTLKNKGLIAIWGYYLPFAVVSSKKLEDFLKDYFDKYIKFYDHPCASHLLNKYETIEFPFKEIKAPAFFIEEAWDLEYFKGYVSTWTITEKFKKDFGKTHWEIIENEIKKIWTKPEIKFKFKNKLFLKLGRLP